MQHQFDVIIERDEEGYYVASVPQLPGCHTQGRLLDELTERIREAVSLCLEVDGVPEQKLEFVGIQRIVPACAGGPVYPGLFNKILRDCQLSVDDLQKLL